MNSILVNPYNQYLDLEQRAERSPQKILTTFSPRLNAQFDSGGIEPTNVVLVGAKYGVGKTYFALNWILHLIRDGKKVTFFSLDMDFHKIFVKILRNIAGVGRNDAEMLMKNEKDYVREKLKSAGYFDNLRIYTNEKRPISFREISFICTEEKPDVVFIDHFGKIHGTGHNPYQETKIISAYLQKMKMEINTTFVALIQMRKGDGRGKNPNAIPPGKDDYKGAGEIGEDADIMLSLARPDLDESCPIDRKSIIVGALRKNRLKDEPDIGHLFWRYDPVSTRMNDLNLSSSY